MMQRRVVRGLVVLFFGVGSVLPISEASAQDPELLITFGEVSGSIGEVVSIPVSVETVNDTLSGFQITLNLSRPDLMYFDVDTTVDEYDETTFVCRVDTAGCLTSGWEMVVARSIVGAGLELRITGLAYALEPPDTRGIPEQTTGVLFRVFGHLICDLPDFVTDSLVEIQISHGLSYYSQPSGELIDPVEHQNGSVTLLNLIPGDITLDRVANPVDVVYLAAHVYRGHELPCCTESADLNCDGSVNPVDVVYQVVQVYGGQTLEPCP